MSAAVCRSPAAAAFQLPSWFAPAVPPRRMRTGPGNSTYGTPSRPRRRPRQLQHLPMPLCLIPAPTSSASLLPLRQRAYRSFTLETECTENNLASESLLHEAAKTEDREAEAKELKSVNYHCSGSRRSRRGGSPTAAFHLAARWAALPEDASHRRDGRLVVEAVPVPSHNYLHAQRQHGCLRLSFIDTSAAVQGTCRDQRGAVQVVEDPSNQESAALQAKQGEEQEVGNEQEEKNYDEEEELEEEERKWKWWTGDGNRGEGDHTTTAAERRRRHCRQGAPLVVVINKFVGGAPLTDQSAWSTRSTEESQKDDGKEEKIKNCHVGYTTTTAAAAAAAVAAAATSSVGYDWCGKGSPVAPGDGDGCEVATTEAKMLFTTTSRARGSKEELLRHMRRCNQLRRRPLFIWEPCCIATSS
uniref:FAF domain-containing protein n=1 Tax=Ananas comosus var. bracteatus TaxID=296719 RepID=A0A6V7PQ39_ANACO|nr:unnamed protein product [Ananas comosus var. bracteatus]